MARGVPHTMGECDDCGAYFDGRGTSKADNARAQAKRHAESTGHSVYVERIVTTRFNPRGGV